ncbi:MAG: molecular chaperone HtpG [Bacteroidetes bacterium]|nr:MAG: molecular chaperone HtpG [Bacteroidota bacterium]
MSTMKGSIQVNTENIFPIIKKFLYSDHEIFLRELVSNAVDATTKLKALSSLGEFKGELGELFIEVKADKTAGTLSIIDRGVGMTAEEIDKYINQIAFSGAEEFVQNYKDAGESGIIGHFGLGFYSAFMVAKQVEIRTLSHKEGSVGARWTCDGSTEFTIEPFEEKTERGTEIILHIDQENQEFLEDSRISGLLGKYCRFLPVPIKYGKKTEYIDDPSGEKDENGNVKRTGIEVDNYVNNPNPIWRKSPSELKDEDYKAFYQELYPMAEPPLFWIHLNVDYPFNLTGVLYFPKVKNELELQRNKIQLYSNQVFVTDEVKDIVPEFLMLLHGVIDSPDIPLNVSRSFLQADQNVKKITGHITKKVADKLEELFKADREAYQEKWDSFGLFVKYGSVSEEKFADKSLKFALLTNTDKEYFTLEEYKEKIKAAQTDKENKVVMLYTSNPKMQAPFIETAKKRGYDVVNFDGPLDTHYIGFLESKDSDLKIIRVDADAIDKLIDKGEKRESVLSDAQVEALKNDFTGFINNENTEIQAEPLSPDDHFITIIKPEWERRMKEMSQMGGGMDFYGMMPERRVVLINTNHNLASRVEQLSDAEQKKAFLSQSYDLALLSQHMLEGEALERFIRRTEEMMK